MAWILVEVAAVQSLRHFYHAWLVFIFTLVAFVSASVRAILPWSLAFFRTSDLVMACFILGGFLEPMTEALTIMTTLQLSPTNFITPTRWDFIKVRCLLNVGNSSVRTLKLNGFLDITS
jgi:hypothetical protein